MRFLPTLCIETGQIFESSKAAAEWLMSKTNWAYSTCKGKIKESCDCSRKIPNTNYTFKRINGDN